MKSFYSKLIITSLIASSGILAADATPGNVPTKFDISRYTYKTQNAASPFESDRTKKIMKTNEMLEGKNDLRKVQYIEQPKVQSVGPAGLINDLDTPWGEMWFYTSDMRYSYIKVSDEYSRPILEEYEFTIYDASMNVVGTIKDKMTYVTYDVLRDPDSVINKDDLELYGPYHREIAVASCELTPIVTKNYFNADDKIEIMVGLSVQTTYYHNNDYNRIYQIGGETYETEDFEGNKQTYNKMLTQIPYLVGDVYATTNRAGKENVYITFMQDIEPDDDFELPDLGGEEEDPGEGEEDDTTEPTDPSELEIPGYWEHYCGCGEKMVTYRGVRQGETEIQPIYEHTIYLSRLAGDMQNSPFMMTLEHNGKMHMIISYYKDTFWNPYHSPLAEMTMRQGNKLVIEVLREKEDGNGFENIQTTEIPTYLTPDYGSQKYLASWFSVGDFLYRKDVQFGEDGKVESFLITKKDYVAGNDDLTIRSYYVYDTAGNLTSTLFERCESVIPMSDIDGFEPQAMFINTNSMGDFIFHFIDLKSGKEVLTQNYQYEIDPDLDPERMTANMDRVKTGNTYMYANELRVPSQDEYGNDNGRILWFNRDGSFDRIDQINMGKNVFYAMTFITGETLDPNFFYVDKNNEYMTLIKRAYEGAGAVEELLVSQARNIDAPEGVVFLTDGPDSRGILGGASIFKNNNKPMLLVSKIDGNSKTYWDIYSLPFNSAGIDEVVAGDKGSAISYDGAIIAAEGNILLFNLHGMQIAKGEDTLSTDGLSAGIYVVMAVGETRKIAVK